MKLELSRGDSPLVIAVQNNNGILVPIQGLDQFLYGDRNFKNTMSSTWKSFV